jgi:lipid-A-disaccharide synthase
MADALDGQVRPLSLRPLVNKVLVVAGEDSGDMYMGRLIGHLSGLLEGASFEGIGGPRMREAGVTTLYDITDMASVGLASAMAKMGVFISALRDLKSKIASGEYDAVILADYPDFNLRIARAADAAGIPLFYYVAPQFWAWRRGRVKVVRECVDMMFVVFPFEEEFYKVRGVNAQFLGHPILDELDFSVDRGAIRAELGLRPNELLLGLLPGSRRGEVARMYPDMLSAVRIIRANKPVKVVTMCADSMDEDFLRELAADIGEEPLIVKGRTWEVMNACDLLLCKSGTSTLQAALAGTPMVVVYKADSFSYMLAKVLSRVKWASIPNLLARREIAPELIQWKATPQSVASAAIPYLTDPARREEMRRELLKLRPGLGERGASHRAATAIVEFLKKLKEV